MGVLRDDLIMKSVIPVINFSSFNKILNKIILKLLFKVVMAGILGIYGMIVAVIIG